MLDGYKSYFLSALGLVVVIGGAVGFFETEVVVQLLSLIGVGSIATLRSAIK